MPSASSRALCRKLWAISGRNTFSSKLPDAPPMLIATSLPNTWQHSIVSASLCVGLTLPGMIDEPGSFSGMRSSPMPLRGPLASQRMSLAIFIRLAASVFSAPCACTSASSAGKRLELVRRRDERQAGETRQLLGDAFGIARRRIQPGADRGAAERQLAQMRQAGMQVAVGLLELRHVAGELLAERERRRILQMRAADLHDVLECASTWRPAWP